MLIGVSYVCLSRFRELLSATKRRGSGTMEGSCRDEANVSLATLTSNLSISSTDALPAVSGGTTANAADNSPSGHIIPDVTKTLPRGINDKQTSEQQHRTEQRRLLLSKTRQTSQEEIGARDSSYLNVKHANMEAQPNMHAVSRRRVSHDVSSLHQTQTSLSRQQHVSTEPAKLYHSSGDIAGFELLASDQQQEKKRPPPRRRSAALVDATAVHHTSAAAITAVVEQCASGRRAGDSRHTHRLSTRHRDEVSASPPSSPILDHTSHVDSCGNSRAAKTKSFRHRQYPKLPQQKATSPSVSQESLASVEDIVADVTSSSSQQLDTEDAGLPLKLKYQQQYHQDSGDPSHKHKYTIKQTFKNIIGKNKDGSNTYMVTDDDNSSLSCGDSSVSQTPTLEVTSTSPSYSPFASKSVLPSHQSSGNTNSDDTLLACDSDSSTSQDLKKVLASSPHNLKQSQLKKRDTCAACNKIFNNFFLKHGYKCVMCRSVFHQRCVELSASIPCYAPAISGSLHQRPAISTTSLASNSSVSTTTTNSYSSPQQHRHSTVLLAAKKPRHDTSRLDKWSLTGTSQFMDKSVEVITDAQQLQALDEFITKKLFSLQKLGGPSPLLPTPRADSDSRDRKDSQVFIESLRSFKDELVSQNSMAMRRDNQECKLKYQDLTNNFERIMTTVSRQQMGGSTFPVTMGVNAFRGFIDEFLQTSVSSSTGNKKRRRRNNNNRRKKKDKKPIEEVLHGSHKFSHIMVNIPTLCEVCNSFLWLSAKGLTCRSCKYTCHEKCLSKVESICSPNPGKVMVVGASTPKTKAGHAAPQPIICKVIKSSIYRVATPPSILGMSFNFFVATHVLFTQLTNIIVKTPTIALIRSCQHF